MNKNTQTQTGEGNAPRNLGEAMIEEETLSDLSKVYNVHIPKQTIYCRNQIAAINLITSLSKAISEAQS